MNRLFLHLMAVAALSESAMVSAMADRKSPIYKKEENRMSAGRNDKCPCNSGVKFKKCCGKPQNNNQ